MKHTLLGSGRWTKFSACSQHVEISHIHNIVQRKNIKLTTTILGQLKLITNPFSEFCTALTLISLHLHHQYPIPTFTPATNFIWFVPDDIACIPCHIFSVSFPWSALWIMLVGRNLVYWAVFPSILPFSSMYLRSSHCDCRLSRVFQATLSQVMFSSSSRVISPVHYAFILRVPSNLEATRKRKVPRRHFNHMLESPHTCNFSSD